MNGMYTMRHEESLQVGGHDTYWSLGGLYFIYRCPTSQTWSIGQRFELRGARAGNCNAYAHHPAKNKQVASLLPLGRGTSLKGRLCDEAEGVGVQQ